METGDAQPGCSKSEPNPNLEDETTQYQTREEYTEKLRKWLEDARIWHGVCAGFPYYYSSIQNQNGTPTNPNQFMETFLRQRHAASGDNNGQQPTVVPPQNFMQPPQNFMQPPPFMQPPQFMPPFVVQPQTQATNNLEFIIPPLWKRIAAELMDFLILFIIKMALTFILLESFNLLSFEYYGIENFQKTLENPKIAMQISMELITLETLHRIIVCVYEAYFLKGGMCATPGKRYMGLMVVYVDNIHPVPGRPLETVRLSNCTPLGFQKSVIRAVLKNLFFGLLLPVCFALYVFRFNRTGYDMVSNSLVVECNPNNVIVQEAL